MKIQLLDKELFYNHNKSEINKIIKEILNTGSFILGKNVKKFENEFAEYCGVKNCIGVGNGTDAIEISLRALGVGRGDYVACTANAGFYSSAAIINNQAIPYYIDISLKKMTMDPESLKGVISKKIKAIIVTHLYGQMADIKKIKSIADHYGIPIIEDCAQSHGASLDGKKAGSWGKIGCFSFYPTKNLGALGDGGAIILSDNHLARKIRKLRQYGWGEKYYIDNQVGKNSRLDEIQAGVLRLKLKYLDDLNKKRVDIAKKYSKELSQLNMVLPDNFNSDYVAHLYTVRVPNRLEIIEKLKNENIDSGIYYPISDDQQNYNQKKIKSAFLTKTYESCNSVLSLPCSPFLSKTNQRKIISTLLN